MIVPIASIQMFREAKGVLKGEEERAERQERLWRYRKGYLDRRYDMGRMDINAYVS